MWARLVLVTLGPGKQAEAEAAADRFARVLRGLNGFEHVTFIADPVAGEYGSISLWKSKEDAENVAVTAGPRVRQDLRELAKGPPRVRLFQIYTPKS